MLVFGRLKKEIIIIAILAFGIMALSLTPWYVLKVNTPAGHAFNPVHNSQSDYPYYTSIIRQGIEGGLLVQDRYAWEPHSGSIIHYFYLSLGWIGRFWHINDPNIVYHLSRVVLGLVWMGVIYLIICQFLNKFYQRIIGFFLAVYSSGFPKIEIQNGNPIITWFMTWWTELDPTQRSAFVPHFTAGHILMGICIILVLKIISQKSYTREQKEDLKKKFFFNLSTVNYQLLTIFISGFLAGFVHPPSLIILLLIVPVWLLLLLISQKIHRSQAVKLLIALGMGATSLIILKIQSSVFPWSSASAFEGLSFYVPIWDYLLGLGPIVVLGLWGIWLKRKDHKVWLLVLWIVISIIMLDRVRFFPFSKIVFIKKLAFSNIRMLQVSLWVPFSILSVYALDFIKHKFGSTVFLVTMTTIIFLTFVGFPETLKTQSTKLFGSNVLMYPSESWMEAIKSFSSIEPKGKAILSLPLAGEFIPPYSGRTVYVGQEVYTPDHKKKMDLSWQFYRGLIDKCHAYNLVKDNNIGIVFYGYDEKNAGSAIKTYPFMLPYKKIGETEIYLFTDVRPVGC